MNSKSGQRRIGKYEIGYIETVFDVENYPISKNKNRMIEVDDIQIRYYNRKR